MIKENEIVTKTYLDKSLSGFVTKTYLDQALSGFVTKTHLENILNKRLKEQEHAILREVRIMIHDTMTGAMENMKTYYEASTEKYLKALLQGFQDEMRVYKDGIKMFSGKLDNHEVRITKLETTAL